LNIRSEKRTFHTCGRFVKDILINTTIKNVNFTLLTIDNIF